MKQDKAVAFCREHSPGNLPYLLGADWYSDRVCKLYRLLVALNAYGMVDKRITCGSGRFFRDGRVRELFQAFMSADLSESAIPLSSVVMQKQVSSHRKWDTAWRDISSSLKCIALYRKRYNVAVSLELQIREFDAKTAGKLCDLVGEDGLESVDFRFDCPPADRGLSRALIGQLGDFCQNPSSRKSKVSLSNFPFCFVPRDAYRCLYNRIVASVVGEIGLQRKAITDLKTRDTDRKEDEKQPCFSGCRECRCRLSCHTFTDIRKHPDYQPFLSAKRQATVAFVSDNHLPEARRPDVVYLSPAGQGDMLMAVLEGFRNILIVDGGGCGRFPCTTFEVMLALENGVNVLGASGTGALRAVELDVCGMRGAGYVYQYLKRQHFKPYHIASGGCKEMSSPATIRPVNLIYLLDCARHKKLIAEDDFRRCVEVAQSPAGAGPTFAPFFRRLRESRVTPRRTVEKLERYLAAEGEQASDIGKKDALLLLRNFESIITERSQPVSAIFRKARRHYLTVVKNKYRENFRPVLPHNWREPLSSGKVRAAGAAQNGREKSVEKTRSLALAFLRDLDLSVADLSGYGACGGSSVLGVLVPLYFLGCYVCCAGGGRDVFDEALVSACMELIERIPMSHYNLEAITPPAAAKGEVFPLDQIPQYYNWLQTEEEKRRMVNDLGYVQATDIVSSRNVFVPAFAATSVNSGSDGNAAGNSLAEAVLHAIYELIERDIAVVYDYFICPALRSRLVIDNRNVQHARCRTLIEAMERSRYRPVLLNFVNIYGIPCVRCDVYNLDSGVVGRSATAAHTDLNRALFGSLSEAFMQCAIYDSGIRDDTVPFTSGSARVLFSQGMSLFPKRSESFEPPAAVPRFGSIPQEIEFLTGRLAECGVNHILVVNNSPRERYGLKTVKLMIPGLDIDGVRPFVPSPWLEDKVQKTLSLIARVTDRDPVACRTAA